MDDKQATETQVSLDEEVREVKVKLPVDQIMRLHYARMKQGSNFSKIVSSALTRYFQDLSKA
ncbi:MAG: hypothetical protein QOD77_1531 [Thermoplasmata archaeon]|jgi:hypothetical protein|nr:hypothetical protein [Thermoplasmata archaeon]